MALAQREFELTVKSRTVPGVLFLPERQEERVPVILAQHGGSSHKLGQEIQDWAALFTGPPRHGGGRH